ncbi:energy transducer TonB [Thiomicrorhabdus cannonii]|uniref:energy transducer TonB n=1 Tax=Thiomicrorhabdus cannonii TaxID=2748011 RepID=UPI0015B8C956|nr:energy transducer TonB [Thiomicrorhabdus cannonii]
MFNFKRTATFTSFLGALLLHALLIAWFWQIATPELHAQEQTEQVTWVELTQVSPPAAMPQPLPQTVQPVEEVIENDPLAEETIKKPEIEEPKKPEKTQEPQPKPQPKPKPKKPVEKPLEKVVEEPVEASEPLQPNDTDLPPVDSPLKEMTPEALPVSAPPEEPLIEATADYLNNPLPHYPRLSKRAGEEGTVVLKVLVGAAGQARQVELHTTSGYARLDQAALEAVKHWQFRPAKQGSVTIESSVLVPVKFVLQS